MIISKELNDEIIEALENLLDDIDNCCDDEGDIAGCCPTCAARLAATRLLTKLKNLRPEDLV